MTTAKNKKKQSSTYAFILRGKSFQEGMLLLINFLPKENWKNFSCPPRLTLKKYVQILYINYLNKLDEASTHKDMKQILNSLLKNYEALLIEFTTLDQPFESLKVAERCFVWKKGREVLRTNCGNIIQHETPKEILSKKNIYANYKLIYKEYEQVVGTTPPLWFQWLPKWQQNFIEVNWRELITHSIPSSLRHVAGLANFSQHSLSIKGQSKLSYNRHATPLPIDLLNRANANEETFRLTLLNLASQIRISLVQQFAETVDNAKKEVVILTQSFLSPGILATLKSHYISGLSDNDTQIYQYKEKAVKRFEEAFKNLMENKTFLEKHDFKIIIQDCGEYKLQYGKHIIDKITLLSTNRPQNLLRRFGTYPEQTKNNDFNTAKMLGVVSRYLMPLISSIKSIKFSDLIPELLEKSLTIAVNNFLIALVTKLIDCEKNKKLSDKDKKDLLEIFKNFDLDDDRMIKAVFNDENTAKLLSALKSLFSISSGQGSFKLNDERHKQSLVSALEVIIVNHIGGTPWIACKSGKDRTGAVSTAIDAAEVFYKLRGRYPRFQDVQVDRKFYIKICNMLFNSGHHQEVASQNAPGARGLINPTSFLPSDTLKGIVGGKEQTELGRLNKPKPRKSKKNFYSRSLLTKLDKIKFKLRTKNKDGFLADWQSNWKNYFIEGISIRELRGNKEFESEEDLLKFITEKLLFKIKDKNLKNFYLRQIPFAFNQKGFQSVFADLFLKLQTNRSAINSNVDVVSGNSKDDFQIHFSALENGIQLEATNIYSIKKMIQKKGEGDAQETTPFHKECYFLNIFGISVIANQHKNGYQLNSIVDKSYVSTMGDRLEPLFIARSWFDILIDIIVRIYNALKSWKPSKVESAYKKNSSSFDGCETEVQNNAAEQKLPIFNTVISNSQSFTPNSKRKIITKFPPLTTWAGFFKFTHETHKEAPHSIQFRNLL